MAGGAEEEAYQHCGSGVPLADPMRSPGAVVALQGCPKLRQWFVSLHQPVTGRGLPLGMRWFPEAEGRFQ